MNKRNASPVTSGSTSRKTVYSVVGQASEAAAERTSKAASKRKKSKVAPGKVAVLEVSTRTKNPYAIGTEATIRLAKKAGMLTPSGKLSALFK